MMYQHHRFDLTKSSITDSVIPRRAWTSGGDLGKRAGECRLYFIHCVKLNQGYIVECTLVRHMTDAIWPLYSSSSFSSLLWFRNRKAATNLVMDCLSLSTAGSGWCIVKSVYRASCIWYDICTLLYATLIHTCTLLYYVWNSLIV